MSEESNKPLASSSVGPYSAGLFQNVIANGDGKEVTVKSLSLSKGYFDKRENQMKRQSISIKPAELGSVIALLQQMQTVVIENRTQPF